MSSSRSGCTAYNSHKYRVGSFSVMDRKIRTQAYARPKAFALLCVLLVLFAGFAQANHVHAAKSNSPAAECSVCSVAHATQSSSSHIARFLFFDARFL